MTIRHNPTDIKIHTNAEEYKQLESTFGSLFDDTTDFYLLLALYGYNRGEKIGLNEDDGSNSEHTFSRTVYQKNEVTMHSDFGLLTILDNLDKAYGEVVNELAFAKMNDKNKSYVKLPNVQTYYSYLLGGIKPLLEDLFPLGHSSSIIELAKTIYTLLDSSEEDYKLLSEQLVLDLESDFYGEES